MQILLVLAVIILAASGLPVKETSHSIRLLEPSTLSSLKLSRRAHLNTTDFVFGGIHARIGQFPMQTFLAYTTTDGKSYSCGGSVISATHVLTAAHCTYDMYSGFVMAGGVNVNFNSSPQEQWRAVTRVVTHVGFDIDNEDRLDDIAVIEVSPGFDLNDDVKTATIVSDDEALLQEPTAVVSGYGVYRMENTTGITSDDLLFTEVDIFSSNYCNETWNGTFADSQICAGAAGRGAGAGDSGGPIQVRYNGELVQIGLTSFGDDEKAEHNQDKVPTLFTRVSTYCDFIDDATNGVVKCGNLPTTIAPPTTAF